MKKLITVCMIAVLSLFFISGCQKGDATSQKNSELASSSEQVGSQQSGASNSESDSSKNSALNSSASNNSSNKSSASNSLASDNSTKVTDIKQAEKHGLPIVFLNVGNDYEITENDEEYISSKITCYNADGSINVAECSLGARVRGNTTKTFDKKPYALKFNSKTRVYNLGSAKSKRYNLLANRCDRTAIRNSVALTFCEQMGVNYVPDYQEVELYYNGDFRGTYILCEAVNEDEGRATVTNKGYLVVLSKNAPSTAVTFKDGEGVLYEIKNDNTDTATIKNKFDTALNAVKSGVKSEVEKYIDLDSAVNAYVIEETLNNMDVGWDSFYFTVNDASSKIVFGPLWDFDVSLGNGNDDSQYSTGFNACQKSDLSVENSRSNLWFYYLSQQKWFRETVKERWNQQQVKTALSDLKTNITAYSQKYKTAYEINFTKWEKIKDGKIEKINFENDEILSLTTYQSQVSYMLNWIETRISWLDEQFNSTEYINGYMPRHGDLN
ncbi:MAG: CotH kinase family protein [Christensenellaceae bacterium]